MSHKTMIDGVAYEISGGKTLINGTAYSIKNGKTLVGGTAYEVGFVKRPKITVYGNGEYIENSNGYYAEAWVEHNGIRYYTPTTFEANIGDIIYCHGRANYSNGMVRSPDINDSIPGAGYEYTVVADAYIKISPYLYSDESGVDIYISPVPEGGHAFFMESAERYYTAEDGMTWAEWNSSKYKYLYYALRISGDYILTDYAGNALTLNGVFVKPTDIIVANATYSYAKKP